MLDDLVEGAEGAIRLSEEVKADSSALLKSACEIF